MSRDGRIVVALGGNALLPRGERPGQETQGRKLEDAVDRLAVLARRHDLVVVHGSGPQVGMLALRAERDRARRGGGGEDGEGADGDGSGALAEPLDVLEAEIEGMMGYLLQRELGGRLPGRPVVSLLTQVAVRPDDPAFGEPTKPIGPRYPEERARRLAGERGWSVAPDGDGWRRVVPSPEPTRVLEIESVRVLLDAGHLVIAGGGGGVPVVIGEDGYLVGVEAVVDKDLTAALLASEVGADRLLFLTDVAAVFRDWPHAAEPVRETTPSGLRALRLPAGSMGPKAEAAARFVERTGGQAAIGALADAEALLAGDGGTRVRPE